MVDILAWTKEAWRDYKYWQGQDKKTLKRINKLISDTQSTPFEGIGKPESLKENLSGFGLVVLMRVIGWYMWLITINLQLFHVAITMKNERGKLTRNLSRFYYLNS